ncbi:MAG: hypothetical protein AAB774_01910 [Patescibacteria group bacterium]
MRQGASNPKIFGSSYQPPSPKSPRRISQAWRPIIGLLVIISGILLIGRLPIFRIDTVELSGGGNDIVRQQLDDLIGQSLFSGSVSRLIEKTQAVTDVDNFTCRRGIPSVLRCQLTLKQPQIVWQSGSQSYFIDKDGVIFAPVSGDISKLLLIEDTKQQPITLGQNIVSAEIINTYQHLIALLAEKNLAASRLQLDESLYQVTAVIDRPSQPSIKGLFLMSNDLDSQVESVATVLAQKSGSVTERIDVRVPGYVYTK